MEYAGFFDFNETGKYDDSVINVEDYPNAKDIADEMAKRYNNFDAMKEIIEEVNHELVEFGTVGMETHSRIVSILKQLES